MISNQFSLVESIIYGKKTKLLGLVSDQRKNWETLVLSNVNIIHAR